MEKITKNLLLILVVMAIGFAAGCSRSNERLVVAATNVDASTQTSPERQMAVGLTGRKGDVSTDGSDLTKLTYCGIGWLGFSTLDPFYTSGALGVVTMYNLVDALWDVPYGGTSEVGICVKDWTISEDGCTIDANLYDNIYDWEGTHITASDVKWFYDYYNGPVVKKALTNISSLEQTGTYSIRIVLKFPYYPGFLQTACANIRPVSEATYMANPNRFRNDPVGTGQYKCIEFTSGARAVFQKTNKYWGDENRLPQQRQANVDVLCFDVITEQSQKTTALKSHAVQLATVSASVAEDFIKENGDIKIKEGDAYPDALMLNMYPGSVFSNNLALRQAVSYALDMQPVLQAVGRGFGKAPGTFGNDKLIGYNMDWEYKYYQHDLEKAKQKLAEAGYRPGQLTLRYIDNSNFAAELGLIMQAQLAEIGINLEIRMLDETQYLSIRALPNALDWDICHYPNPGKNFIMNGFNTYTNITTYPWGALNGSNDKEMYDIAQKALYDQTQENIDAVFYALAERVWFLPTYHIPYFYAYYDKIAEPQTSFDPELVLSGGFFGSDYDIFYKK